MRKRNNFDHLSRLTFWLHFAAAKTAWKFQASTSNTLRCDPAEISRDSAVCVSASFFLQVPATSWGEECWSFWCECMSSPCKGAVAAMVRCSKSTFWAVLGGTLSTAGNHMPRNIWWALCEPCDISWYETQTQVPIKRIHTALLLTSFEAMVLHGCISDY